MEYLEQRGTAPRVQAQVGCLDMPPVELPEGTSPVRRPPPLQWLPPHPIEIPVRTAAARIARPR